jgi:hypothetical protein
VVNTRSLRGPTGLLHALGRQYFGLRSFKTVRLASPSDCKVPEPARNVIGVQRQQPLHGCPSHHSTARPGYEPRMPRFFGEPRSSLTSSCAPVSLLLRESQKLLRATPALTNRSVMRLPRSAQRRRFGQQLFRIPRDDEPERHP